MNRFNKITLVVNILVIAILLIFLVWRHRESSFVQDSMANLIGALIGAFLGAWLGFKYDRKQAREEAERIRDEKRRNLREVVFHVLVFDYPIAEGLSEYDSGESVLNMQNIDPFILDSVATLWHELLYDLGTIYVEGTGHQMSSSLLFEHLRRSMRDLHHSFNVQAEIDARIGLGDRTLDSDKAWGARKIHAEIIREDARRVVKAMDALFKLIDMESSQVDAGK